MAKLHSYYVLCPLIDQKSFLGVSQDSDDDNVLVTLGRNVVNKYRLSDQKQIGGYTSKDHITAEVIFDKEQNSYVGVFNNNTVKLWKEDLDTLEKLKKHKFPLNILKIIPKPDASSLIVFTNGACVSLSYGLDNRKSCDGKSILKTNESIIDSAVYTRNKVDYVCHIVRSDKYKYEIVHCALRSELSDMEKATFSKVKVEREEDGIYVVGQLISATERSVVYFLWSDAKMTVFDLITKSWKTIGTVPWVSCSSCVSLAWMGDNHLILFGSSLEQDGAIIVAYNTSLGVGSCRYPMKMYTDNAKLYCFKNRIVLEASNHIGMLPYVVETSRSLASLLGSHEVIQEEKLMIADWNTSTEPNFEVAESLKEQIELGLSERVICAQTISPLIENKAKLPSIIDVLNQFNDVPETTIVNLLSYALNMIDTKNIDVANKESITKQFSNKLGQSISNFLYYILQLPFSDSLIIPYLQNIVCLNDALFLITFISIKLVENHVFDSQLDSKLLDWCTLLMDAYYQQYLLTKDEKVSVVLENMRDVVGDLIDQLLKIDETLPLLNKLLSGKSLECNNDKLSYSIELMEI